MAELEQAEGVAPSAIGPYRLARRLGQGGMGEVFLAWDERLGRRVAVKRILRDTPRPQDRERLRREARAAARLSHPAVVQVYDFVEDATGDAIVLEYVEGRTLRALLAEGVPPIDLTVHLAREIAEGLSAAHAAGLVHRDLKAENVVVTREGHAKILDFGIAKLPESEALTAQGMVVGTAHAMSPEQARGGEVDARSDLFSLGILLHELLTGTSPFRGSNSLDALQQVISHVPPPVSSLRPEVPRALSDLVDRLLAKRPEGRPKSAGEVARTLTALAPQPALATDTAELSAGTASTLVDLPAVFAAGGALRMSSTAVRSRRLPLVLLLVLLAALTVSSGWLVQGLLKRGSPEPLRVAVLAPQVGAGEEPGLVASGLLTATLSALASLEGLAPLDPAQVGLAATPVEAARTAAANEVLALGLQREDGRARVSLRRIAGADGRVLWTASFPVPTGSGDRDLRLLADAVAVHLRQAYPDRRLRPRVPELAVGDRDYAELLRIKDRIDRGSTDLEPELERLEKVARDSPRFIEAQLLLADVARSLFKANRRPADLEVGLQAARTAAEIAPGDPRPLVARFHLALVAGRHGDAEADLEALSGMVPGDPQLHALAGALAESRGDLERAVAELSAAVEGAPSWANLYNLANVEARAGHIAAARRHLKDLLARSPGNHWGLDRLASLELLEGDPRRADRIYLDLLRQKPQRRHYTQLGLARSLLGRHREAVEAYRRALEFDSDNPYLLLNLADARLALGQMDEAHRLYGRTLESLARQEAAAALSPLQRMVRAQCLVRLGKVREAVEGTQQALRESGDDPEILYAASLVYAQAGDRASALVNAGLALKKGMHPRWFTLPAFGPLRDDPELRELLRGINPRAATPAAR